MNAADSERLFRLHNFMCHMLVWTDRILFHRLCHYCNPGADFYRCHILWHCSHACDIRHSICGIMREFQWILQGDCDTLSTYVNLKIKPC